MKPVESCHDIVEAEEKNLALRTGQEGRRIGVNAMVESWCPIQCPCSSERGGPEAIVAISKQAR